MASARQSTNRFRQRKLSTKQVIAIVREADLDQVVDDEASRNVPRIESGVEKAEEIVSHHFNLPVQVSPLSPSSTI